MKTTSKFSPVLIPGEYTLRLYSTSQANPRFLSEISWADINTPRAKFDCYNREIAITMAEGDSHILCDKLKAQDIKCYVVCAKIH